ncbi:MAG TPA: arsenate reductase ArsC, partial [Methylotenera sp.]|nr:arsenate reductase ArsC [Methylotenera sp.]
MAEALFNTMGDGVFKAYSAGIYPAGVVNRFVLEEIKDIGYPYKKLKSKSLMEFLNSKAPIMNFVISVCEDIPVEAIPLLPGNPMKAHWLFENPGVLDGTFEE